MRASRDEDGLQVFSSAWHRGPNLVPIEHMALQRMEHVGIVVDDLAAATEFFVELGFVLQGKAPVEGRWVDRIVGLDGVRAETAMMQTPDGNGRLELVKRYEDSYRLCYIRGPEGIIIELAEKIGGAADKPNIRARMVLSRSGYWLRPQIGRQIGVSQDQRRQSTQCC